MGTRRLWIALLLAVLQYAAIADGLKICQIAPRSDCTGPDVQTKLPTSGGPCTELSGRPPVCGGGGLLMFFNANGAFGWSEVEDLQCTGIGEWSIMKPTTIKLDDSDNIICAADLPKCTQCAPLVPGTLCDAAKGCIADVPAAASGVEPDTACLKMTCAGGGFFITDAPSQEDDLNVIKCDADGAWSYTPEGQSAVVVTKAVCVKKYLCSVMSPPKDACSTLPSHIQCKKVPLIDGAINKCIGLGLKMFYKKIGKQNWMEETGDEMKCIEATGKWELSSESIIAGDEVVCADKSPDTPAPVLECQLGPNNPLTSDCGLTPAKSASCVPFTTINTDPTLTCTTGSLYMQLSGQPWTTGSPDIICDKLVGKWKDALGNDQVGGTNFVCALDDPSPVLCTTKSPPPAALTSTCLSELNANSGCKPATITDDGPLTCPPASSIVYYRATGTGLWTEPQDKTIKCDKTTGDWKQGSVGQTAFDGTNVVCAASNPEPLKCTDLSSLTSKCPQESPPTTACARATITDTDAVSCPSASPSLFFYSDATEKSTEVVDNLIRCDQSIQEWKHGLARDTLSGANVVCAKSNPSPISCMGDGTSGPAVLTSKCPQGFNPDSFCQTITPTDDMPDTFCPSGSLYTRPTNGNWQEANENTINCDKKTGTWTQGSFPSPLTANEVVCAAMDPTPPPGNCPVLKYDCTGLTAVNCEAPTNAYPVWICPNGNKKLYFKNSTMVFFQEAVSILCEDIHWNLKYLYGKSIILNSVKLATGDNLICAESNPDKNVCEYYQPERKDHTYLSKPHPRQHEEAGKQAECLDDVEEYGHAAGNEKVAPTCSQSRDWVTDEGVNIGKKIGCRIHKCKTCATEPTDARLPGTEFGKADIDPIIGGACKKLKCEEQRFGIREEVGGNYFTYAGSVICNDNGDGWVRKSDDNKIPVLEASCAQKLYCLKPGAYVATVACPTGADAIAGCEDPEQSPDETAKTLSCKGGKKMFVQQHTEPADARYWDEAKTDPTCNDELGWWKVDLLGETSVAYRDHQTTFICASVNPKPKPTTTTTTTTLAPLRPICDVCKEALDQLDLVTCETCNNATKLDEPNPPAEYGPGDKCLLTPGDGRDLIINNFEQVQRSNPLVCERGERGEQVQWKTTDKTPVSRYSSRLETKKDSWKALSYVVVGAVFVAIGGMGITCVVIFMKMRKQPSSREKKKKERGVTKKYTSSNVVKTGHKSMAATSREGGKSKDGSASKMEDNNEDTPTLKL